MNILILGGTGFVGSHLQDHFQKAGHQVKALGREAFAADFALSEHLNDTDILIMLAGANIGQRWTPSYIEELWNSRLHTNEILKQALQQASLPPQRIFSASAIGIYPEANCTDAVDEHCTDTGDNELGRLGVAWEAASRQLTPTPVIMRFGVVLGANGGALQKMLPPFKLGLGGPVAGGRQCFSWIHIKDLAKAVDFLIDHPQISGAVNLTAPHPVTNREFGKTLANKLHRPFLIPLPEWQLKLMFGQGAMVLTHSAAVVPSRLIETGFEFDYPTIDQALSQIIQP